MGCGCSHAAKKTGLAVGDLVAPLGSKAEIFRVTRKYPQSGYVAVLPYQRGGQEQVLFRHKGKWTDGQVEWLLVGHS